jgi:nicotinate dehydrogenase subunit A
MTTLILHINGHERLMDVDPKTPLIFVLRNDLGLKGAKFGCGLEQCGACLVIVDGKTEYACNTPAAAFEGRKIVTIEGIGTPQNLHPIQQAFIKERAAQCGYCIPGMIVATKALLDTNSDPGKHEIRQALSQNLCRCGAHASIIKAVLRAAREIRS